MAGVGSTAHAHTLHVLLLSDLRSPVPSNAVSVGKKIERRALQSLSTATNREPKVMRPDTQTS